MQFHFIVTALAIVAVQKKDEKDEFLQVSAKKETSNLVKSSVAIPKQVLPKELEIVRDEQAAAKTSLASTNSDHVDLKEDQRSGEHIAQNRTHEHAHKHGHHAHHAHHERHLHAEQTDSTKLSNKITTAEEPEAEEAEDTEETEVVEESGGSCYGNDSRCPDSNEIECDLLEKEGADCRWLGGKSDDGAYAADRSMTVAIHSLLAAFASSA